MRALTRYTIMQLFVGLTLVAASLTCVVWLSQSLRFIDMIINRGLSASMFVFLTGLMLPNFLTIILPISLFATTMFVYHRMIMDRELVVMRVAGLSQFSLAKPALLLAFGVVGVGYALSTYLVPTSYTQFRSLQWDIRYNFSHLLLREGTFNDAAKGITIYVRERTDDGQLLGILAYDDRNEKRSFTIISERGVMVQSKSGAQVVMFNGSRQDFNKATKQLSILYFDRYVFQMDAPNTAGLIRHSEPRERSMAGLINLDETGVDHRSIGKYHIELHRRLALPWSALGFVFIAVGSLITGSFNRRGESRRVMFAILYAGAYQAMLLTSLNMAAKNEILIPLIYVVTALPIIIGTLALSLPNWFQFRSLPLPKGRAKV